MFYGLVGEVGLGRKMVGIWKKISEKPLTSFERLPTLQTKSLGRVGKMPLVPCNFSELGSGDTWVFVVFYHWTKASEQIVRLTPM